MQIHLELVSDVVLGCKFQLGNLSKAEVERILILVSIEGSNSN